MKAVEVRDLIEGIALNKPLWPDFRAAYNVNRIMDAAEESFEKRKWITLS
jgi:predicted dehydrogenase